MTRVQCVEAEGSLLSIFLGPHLEVVWDACEHFVSAVLIDRIEEPPSRGLWMYICNLNPLWISYSG